MTTRFVVGSEYLGVDDMENHYSEAHTWQQNFYTTRPTLFSLLSSLRK